MAKLAPEEIQYILAQLASTTARSPETAAAAGAAGKGAQASLARLYEERKKEAKKKKKKAGVVGTAGRIAGTVGGFALGGPAGAAVGSEIGGITGRRVGGADESVLQSALAEAPAAAKAATPALGAKLSLGNVGTAFGEGAAASAPGLGAPATSGFASKFGKALASPGGQAAVSEMTSRLSTAPHVDPAKIPLGLAPEHIRASQEQERAIARERSVNEFRTKELKLQKQQIELREEGMRIAAADRATGLEISKGHLDVAEAAGERAATTAASTETYRGKILSQREAELGIAQTAEDRAVTKFGERETPAQQRERDLVHKEKLRDPKYMTAAEAAAVSDRDRGFKADLLESVRETAEKLDVNDLPNIDNVDEAIRQLDGYKNELSSEEYEYARKQLLILKEQLSSRKEQGPPAGEPDTEVITPRTLRELMEGYRRGSVGR